MGWEVILEKEMATHCSILAWKMPCTEEPDELQSMGSQRVRDDWAYTHTHTHTHEMTMKQLNMISFFLLQNMMP